MSRNLSTTARQALFSQETDQIFLPLLTITYGGTTLRYVRNTADIVSGGNTYTAYPFNINLPDETADGSISSVKLTIDNVDRRFTPILRGITVAPTVTLQIVLASSPNTVEVGPLSFSLSDFTYDQDAITGTLIYEDKLQTRVPSLDFNPFDFPGLFY